MGGAGASMLDWIEELAMRRCCARDFSITSSALVRDATGSSCSGRSVVRSGFVSTGLSAMFFFPFLILSA